MQNTSPGRIASIGNFVRKCFTQIAMALTCPGVPVTACATISPRRLKTPADRSPHSRTDWLKAVRMTV